MTREHNRVCDRDNFNVISTRNRANLFDDIQVSIPSSLQKTQRTIMLHNFSKTITLQTNFFILSFRSRVLKTLSREFNMTTKALSCRDFVTMTNVAIFQTLLTIAFNVDFSRFEIKFINVEIVEHEMKNKKCARFLAKKIVAKGIQNLTRLKN